MFYFVDGTLATVQTNSDAKGKVRFWDVAGQKATRQFTLAPMVRSPAWSADGGMLAMVTTPPGPSPLLLLAGAEVPPSRVKIYSTITGKQIAVIPVAGTWSMAFSPDGKRLATGLMDGTILLWDLEKFVTDAREQKVTETPKNP